LAISKDGKYLVIADQGNFRLQVFLLEPILDSLKQNSMQRHLWLPVSGTVRDVMYFQTHLGQVKRFLRTSAKPYLRYSDNTGSVR